MSHDGRDRAAFENEAVEGFERREGLRRRRDVADSALFHGCGTDLRFELDRVVDELDGLGGRNAELGAPEFGQRLPAGEKRFGFFAVGLTEMAFGRISFRGQCCEVLLEVEPDRV